jgi:hypothetical protein
VAADIKALGPPVLLAVAVVGCGPRQFQFPPGPGVVKPDERRAFECFTEQLPNMLHETYGSFHWPDGGVSDSWFAKPKHSQYYVCDTGARVEFYVAGKTPPRDQGSEFITVCMDGCGAFLVSYAKEATLARG